MTKAKKRAWKAMLEVVRDLLRENPEARATLHCPPRPWAL
jgi:hypothetical protein